MWYIDKSDVKCRRHGLTRFKSVGGAIKLDLNVSQEQPNQIVKIGVYLNQLLTLAVETQNSSQKSWHNFRKKLPLKISPLAMFIKRKKVKFEDWNEA